MMGDNTKIEWTHHTFNPWVGCTKVSPACDHCYAEGWAKRSGMVQWGPHAERRRTSESNWRQPLKWNAEAERLGVRYRVFCSSLADVFDNAVPTEWRYDLFNIILSTPHLDWLLLTKRIGNARKMIEEILPETMKGLPAEHPLAWPWPHVWIGATICNQEEADRDIPKLLMVPADRHFLSMEPLLGSVKLPEVFLKRLHFDGKDHSYPDNAGMIDWVIVGGESGPGARPMHPKWVRSLRDQCQAADVPFLFKQHGEWLATEFCDDDMAMIPSRRTVYVRPDGSFHDGTDGIDFFGGEEETAWIGKLAAGRVLDGKLHDEYPEVRA